MLFCFFKFLHSRGSCRPKLSLDTEALLISCKKTRNHENKFPFFRSPRNATKALVNTKSLLYFLCTFFCFAWGKRHCSGQRFLCLFFVLFFQFSLCMFSPFGDSSCCLWHEYSGIQLPSTSCFLKISFVNYFSCKVPLNYFALLPFVKEYWILHSLCPSTSYFPPFLLSLSSTFCGLVFDLPSSPR